jgi:hypothetical protein
VPDGGVELARVERHGSWPAISAAHGDCCAGRPEFGNWDGGHMHTTLVAARVGTAGSEGDVLHLKYVCCGLGRWEEKPTGLGC